MKLCICRTDDCPNQGVEFLWDCDTAMAEAQSEGYTLGTPTCGCCEQPITDMSDVDGTSPGDGGFTEQDA